ncbi:hypothetical protein [Croceicoccus naphthovorans]|uniref:hypothetical protein n=2 Tax=Croceicoccus naphthovorans TaxID=1348774 RepID=UPI001C54EA93|nr:hypothetical protein [Croceicoccus naphthovorans]
MTVEMIVIAGQDGIAFHPQLYLPNCEYPLNAVLSHETEAYIIENAPINTLTDKNASMRKVIEADLFIKGFEGSEGSKWIIVVRVDELRPINSPRNEFESRYYEIPSDSTIRR